MSTPHSLAAPHPSHECSSSRPSRGPALASRPSTTCGTLRMDQRGNGGSFLASTPCDPPVIRRTAYHVSRECHSACSIRLQARVHSQSGRLPQILHHCGWGQLWVWLEPRACALGPEGLWHPGYHQHIIRRHLLQQLLQGRRMDGWGVWEGGTSIDSVR